MYFACGNPGPRRASVALTICLFTSICLAQQPKVLAPHKPVPPPVEKPVKWHSPATLHSMVGGLWMTDANFQVIDLCKERSRDFSGHRFAHPLLE
jgi:hypothetical protein